MLLLFILNILSTKGVEKTMSDDEYARLYSDIESQGVRLVKSPGRGTGVVSVNGFEEGDPVVCVKNSVGIFPTDEFELSKHLVNFTNYIPLKARVLYEKFMAPRGSYITEYVHSYPTNYFHYGNWTDKQREYYKRLSFEQIDDRALLELDEYESIYNALKDNKDVPEVMLSYASFMWASFQVMSRAFDCYTEEDEEYQCLYPVLDLVNFGPIQYYTFEESFITGSERCILAQKKIMPGEEVFNDYGIHRASIYLIEFSIVQENYRFDSLEFKYNGKIYDLYAFRINEELLEDIIGERLEYITLNKFKKLTNGLRTYRKIFIEYFEGPGIREVRRETSSIKDRTTELINLFGISVRTTYYNHLNKIDNELLKLLLRKNTQYPYLVF